MILEAVTVLISPDVCLDPSASKERRSVTDTPPLLEVITCSTCSQSRCRGCHLLLRAADEDPVDGHAACGYQWAALGRRWRVWWLWFWGVCRGWVRALTWRPASCGLRRGAEPGVLRWRQALRGGVPSAWGQLRRPWTARAHCSGLLAVCGSIWVSRLPIVCRPHATMQGQNLPISLQLSAAAPIA